MKSTRTESTHGGSTKKDLQVTFGATGYTQHSVLVPKGTTCRRLDGGSSPWVVDDLRFIADKKSILYSDADIYGIRVPETEIENIIDLTVSRPMRERGA
jgi:hypothetical protein